MIGIADELRSLRRTRADNGCGARGTGCAAGKAISLRINASLLEEVRRACTDATTACTTRGCDLNALIAFFESHAQPSEIDLVVASEHPQVGFSLEEMLGSQIWRTIGPCFTELKHRVPRAVWRLRLASGRDFTFDLNQVSTPAKILCRDDGSCGLVQP
jgi:hypothetical protein